MRLDGNTDGNHVAKLITAGERLPAPTGTHRHPPAPKRLVEFLGQAGV
jgi:hypothetical protein